MNMAAIIAFMALALIVALALGVCEEIREQIKWYKFRCHMQARRGRQGCRR